LAGVLLAVHAVASSPARSGDGQLRAFYAAHVDLFARPGRVRVEALFFAGDEASVAARASAARARLVAGEAAPAVSASADASPGVVPTGAVTLTALADAMGHATALAVDAQPEGGITRPVPVAGGAWVVRVASREPARIAAFDEVRDEVRAEYARVDGGPGS
jgi:hypothetical protein